MRCLYLLLTINHHHQTFSERLKLEKKRLEDRIGFNENDNTENKSAACCVFCPEIVATASEVSSWAKICCIASSESYYLDVELLAALQHLLVARSAEHQVSE